MSPSKMKLTYFSGRGRAELMRLILAAADVTDYEDVRISFDDLKKVKPGLPFGQLPVLEVDGVQVAQSMAIARFLAKRYGLAGKNELEDAQIDMWADHVRDHFESFDVIFAAKSDADKKALADSLIKEKIPQWLQKSEDLLKKSGGKYIVGNKLTWADIFLFDRTWALSDPTDPFQTKMLKVVDMPERLHLLDKCPTLKAHRDCVAANPGIKRWLAKRPSNDAEMF